MSEPIEEYARQVRAVAEEMAAAADLPVHLLPPEDAASAVAFRATAAGQTEARLADVLAQAGLLRDAPVTPRTFQDAPD